MSARTADAGAAGPSTIGGCWRQGFAPWVGGVGNAFWAFSKRRFAESEPHPLLARVRLSHDGKIVAVAEHAELDLAPESLARRAHRLDVILSICL